MGFTKMLLSLVRFHIAFMTPQSFVKTARKNVQTIRADTFCFYEIRLAFIRYGKRCQIGGKRLMAFSRLVLLLSYITPPAFIEPQRISRFIRFLFSFRRVSLESTFP